MTTFSSRARRILAVASAVGLALVAAAGATTGVLPVGSFIPSESDPEPTHEHGDAQTIVARGASPVAGPWRLTSLRTSGDDPGGEPAADCLQLLLSDPPKGTPIEATMLCESGPTADLSAGSLPVTNVASDRGELLLFGTAPHMADGVKLAGHGRAPLHARTTTTPPGFEGRAWVMAIPRGWSAGQLAWTDEDRQATGPGLDASAHLDRLAEIERIAERGE